MIKLIYFTYRIIITRQYIRCYCLPSICLFFVVIVVVIWDKKLSAEKKNRSMADTHWAVIHYIENTIDPGDIWGEKEMKWEGSTAIGLLLAEVPYVLTRYTVTFES